jgi:4,5-dihydroxyphthalate decarboxylase
MNAGTPSTITLKALLGNYPSTEALKSGRISSDKIALEFIDYNPVWDGFRPMVREEKFDVAEMAIVTYLIAKSFNKPMVLLPAVMSARFQHPFAVYNSERGHLTPSDLNGRRVGIRSFTTTTGAWIRGIMANDYGVDLDSIQWVTFEEPHVAEYNDTTERAPPGKKIIQMLLDGEIDAALGDRSDDPRIKPLFGDPQAEAQHWYRKHGVFPINHLVVVSEKWAKSRPDIVEEVFRVLQDSKKAAPPPGGDFDPTPFGLEPNRAALELIIAYAAQQHLIPRRFTVAELFDDTTRRLGS